MPTESIAKTVDMRGVEISQRHHLFLKNFLALKQGDAFLLFTEGDPDQLLYPIRLIYAGELEVHVRASNEEGWQTLVRRRAMTGRLGQVSI